MRFIGLLLVGFALLGGCGYSLEMSRLEDTPEAPDPITLLRRELRQLKADHRVSIFDLKNEQKLLAERSKADLKKIRDGIGTQLQSDLKSGLLSLRRRDADFGEKISEMEIQLRLMGGSVEEEINRYKDRSEQTNNNALRELGDVKRLLIDEAKEKAGSIKMLRDQINKEKASRLALWSRVQDLLEVQSNHLKTKIAEEKNQREAIQNHIKGMESSSGQVRTSSDEQIKALNEVSTQVDELIEKLLPAVNQLGERLDRQEEQFEALKRKIDVDALNRHLNALTETVEVQRRSLKMLGDTLTAEVDKQKRHLRKIMEDLKALEPK
jgi:hypothetical protein